MRSPTAVMPVKFQLGKWFKENTFIATWVQSVVIIGTILVAAAQYYYDVQKSKSLQSLAYLNIYFTSESISRSRGRMGERFDDLLKQTPENASKEELLSTLYKLSVGLYEEDAETRNDVNNILTFIESMYECTLIDSCDTGTSIRIGASIIKPYYIYLKPIYVCKFDARAERFEAYFDWIYGGRENRVFLDMTEDDCPERS